MKYRSELSHSNCATTFNKSSIINKEKWIFFLELVKNHLFFVFERWISLERIPFTLFIITIAFPMLDLRQFLCKFPFTIYNNLAFQRFFKHFVSNYNITKCMFYEKYKLYTNILYANIKNRKKFFFIINFKSVLYCGFDGIFL